MDADIEFSKLVEESLRKRFKKELFSKFCKAINEYELIKPGDKIAVCISGGKDSMLMAKLFQELKRRWVYRENRLSFGAKLKINTKDENQLKVKALNKTIEEINKENNTKGTVFNKTTGKGVNVTVEDVNNKGVNVTVEDANDKEANVSTFELVFLVMDPGYSKANRERIETNARLLNVPITIFETNIFDNVVNIEKSPCYICARMRRGNLYAKAKELGCNKIALGHHYDDVIETILMGMLYSGQFQTMMPKLKSTNFKGLELIRPLYFIREQDIKQWCKYNKLQFIQCACKFTEMYYKENPENVYINKPYNNTKENASMRLKVKRLIEQLCKENPLVDGNIFKSVENVNLSTVISFKDKFGTHHFLDEY